MHRKILSNTSKILAGASLGFSLFWLTSHPKSKIKSKLPAKQYKNVSLLPNIKYNHKDHTYHFHHWLILTFFYIPLLKSRKLRRSKLFHGLLLGSIFQGLLYKDRFKFKYPKLETLEEELER